MTTAKELALTWFKALVTGDVKTAGELIAPDFRYFLPGTMPASGRKYRKSGAMSSPTVTSPVTSALNQVRAISLVVVILHEPLMEVQDRNKT